MNAVIDNSILRESQWTQKRSTVVACQTVFDLAINLHCPQDEIHNLPFKSSVKEKAKLSHAMKASVVKKVYSD